MDSSGIGALVRAFSALKQGGGKCKFFAAPKRVKQTLKQVRLDTALDLAAGEEPCPPALFGGRRAESHAPHPSLDPALPRHPAARAGLPALPPGRPLAHAGHD